MSKVEELMKPRIKVMMDYPDCEYEVGQIIQFVQKSTYYTGEPEWETGFILTKNGEQVQSCIKKFEPYPDIFKPLEWWEDRKLEDMPEYIQYAGQMAYKIERYELDERMGLYGISAKYEDCPLWLNGMPVLPITEFEYNEYLKTKS